MKKNPEAYDELTKEYFERVKEQGLNYKLCDYVWNVLIAMSKGYGFNLSHTLAYSLIGLQELNLAYHFPILYWDCACLIADSGGNEDNSEEEQEEESVEVEYYYNEMEEFTEEDNEEDIDDSYEEEDCDRYPAKVVVMKNGKKKKKTKTVNYGKVATAIGKIKTRGINVAPPDINKSSFTFTPDLENNTIRYGLSGISKVGEDVVKNIIANRPYSGIDDFLLKVKVTKPQMVNLIKSGAFDCFGDRFEIMREYIGISCDKKKRMTLQNMKMLLDFNLIPDEYDFEIRVYNFNKYIKKFKSGSNYGLTEYAAAFYERHFGADNILCHENQLYINQNKWDNMYKKLMNPIRDYIKANNEELLETVNNRLFMNLWNKYCDGSISKWEMDSVSYYSHEHELSNISLDVYGCVDYELLPEEPVIDRTFLTKDGAKVTMYKIDRIAGTVLDKDKAKGLVTLLTTSGVVNVKIFGPVFAMYDKRISEIGEDGKKHVIEESLLSRGNKIIVTGIRRGDSFICKKYKNTPYHLLEKINIVGDEIILTTRQSS